jgi:hypothetical protein
VEAGIDAPTDGTDPPDASSGLDAGDAGDAADAGAPPPHCPGPDYARGVFVEGGSGMSAASCGDAARPCPTIATALAAVQRGGSVKSFVYLGAGTYTEQVTLPAGVTLQGDWVDQSGTWTRDCDKPMASSSVIRAPAGSTSTVVANYDGSSTLDTLTLESMGSGDVVASQSIYGVFASGASTQLTLHDIHIALVGGGAGTAGGAGTDGTSGAAAGGCDVGSGGAGAAGATGRPGAGSYQSSGYVPGAAADGTAGSAGSNGTAPARAPTCANAADACAPEPQAKSSNLACACGLTLASCGTAGRVGCGGGGSTGGKGGTGGGASIGVFDWDALVSMTNGTIAPGNGGAGGSGGLPGNPGAGTPGAAGNDPPLAAGMGVCTGVATGTGPSSCALCTRGFLVGQAGGAGGVGGGGGQGGRGGGGAGGDSYCVFQGGSGVVRVDPTVTCTPGSGGAGGNQGVAGQGAWGASGLHN